MICGRECGQIFCLPTNAFDIANSENTTYDCLQNMIQPVLLTSRALPLWSGETMMRLSVNYFKTFLSNEPNQPAPR